MSKKESPHQNTTHGKAKANGTCIILGTYITSWYDISIFRYNTTF